MNGSCLKLIWLLKSFSLNQPPGTGSCRSRRLPHRTHYRSVRRVPLLPCHPLTVRLKRLVLALAEPSHRYRVTRKEGYPPRAACEHGGEVCLGGQDPVAIAIVRDELQQTLPSSTDPFLHCLVVSNPAQVARFFVHMHKGLAWI